jgi:hypothetical protein
VTISYFLVVAVSDLLVQILWIADKKEWQARGVD